ncbi:hypothetical protein GOP47_0004934 [Adiantum capillus-veneris]|uniref:Zeaxanthin epoxidase, chloroplastic n=1 Tax=Adiantum capillus-veneris TaxID=13818 RepID=A0A9D4V479_ADICA|nr:hypothetical protein GOP47_0004934 [Adiantum capillus-veneris]
MASSASRPIAPLPPEHKLRSSLHSSLSSSFSLPSDPINCKRPLRFRSSHCPPSPAALRKAAPVPPTTLNGTKCAATASQSVVEDGSSNSLASSGKARPIRIMVAGGGIGGLVFALAAKNKGMDVKVLERDLSAIRGEGQYRGPIQIQSNALAALEAVDQAVAEEIMANGCVTGDRINGLVDGISGDWYCKFDTFTPAAEKGLPVTRVISRMTLQQILARAVGPEIIENSRNVVSFEDDGTKVIVELEDGEKIEGDLLVGADGIRSKVRNKLFGPCEATYSGYTCYTGIADFIPPDIETVGYRVFLGHKQYFVSSDVGYGKMQWYAFYNEPAGGADQGLKKERLLNLFANWCDGVLDLLIATPEEMILRRDIFDRVPIFNWSKGRTTLLGDSAHAMQPNMGQGGCMAIEDGYQLAVELEKSCKESVKDGKPVDVAAALKRYESERVLRAGAIHGMARMAAIMASTYKPYLGVGLGPLEFLTNLRIPHPGRVGGRFFIGIFMPIMLDWVLGGNSSKLEGRVPSCRLTDKANGNLKKWFVDDDALERAVAAEWYLTPARVMMSELDISTAGSDIIRLVQKEGYSVFVGSKAGEPAEGNFVVIEAPGVSSKHAQISYREGAFYITDLRSADGTWITDIEGRRYRLPSLLPRRLRAGYTIGFGEDSKAAFKVKLRKSELSQKAMGNPQPTEYAAAAS